MKKLVPFAILASVFAAPVWASTQTVTLSVPGMTCAACPITVKKALTKVDGVEEVKVSLAQREAVVTFDDSKTRVEALTGATEKAGYPSEIRR
jgi:mercuric ion binding protein